MLREPFWRRAPQPWLPALSAGLCGMAAGFNFADGHGWLGVIFVLAGASNVALAALYPLLMRGDR